MNKQYRLKSNIEIGNIVQARQRVYSPYYTIYYSTEQTECKIAVVVSKKIGNAVVRNHEKRVLREILRPYVMQLNNVHAVVVAKDKSLQISFTEKSQDISKLIKMLIERMKHDQKD